MTLETNPSAAILVIGNEILSGRTQDVNINAAAKRLMQVGIPLREARIVADIESEIVVALNALRARYTYVFTTGGIGPTHDDITVDAIAKAFGVGVIEHPDARALLLAHYGPEKITPARLRMARVPAGASLVANPVSAAPGMRIENVFILAGVPDIMQAMLDGIVSTLRHGPAMHSMTVSGFVAESMIAEALGTLAAECPQLDIGSYPWVKDGRFGTALVTRGTDEVAVKQVSQKILQLVRATDTNATLVVE